MASGYQDSSIHSKNLLSEIQHHIVSYLGNDFTPYRKDTYYYGLALTIRDKLIERWLKTQRALHDQSAKRIYYMSMEFLPGRFLVNNMINLQMLQSCKQALQAVSLELEEIEEQEWDAGLGNGGLGRLASCFLDSMATLGLPGYGCGIRYDYGIFYQDFMEGFQVERCDNWMRNGSPWEIKRRGFLYEIKFYGRSEAYTDASGQTRYRWVDADNIMAMACDFLIPAYGNDNVNNMRLWAALSSREFNLQEFNEGDYIGAVEAKVMSENISKVLYPRDESFAGKELRLKQQYFFVAATLRDILRRFKRFYSDFLRLPDAVAIQLNDTHPCISIPELMRILLDEEGIAWDMAWGICRRVFAYTNHTVLPEALETWPLDLMGKVLPRHMEIIHEINHRFIEEVAIHYPGDHERQASMAIVHDGVIRMANLSVIGSHTVNGVSELHTHILKERLFKAFDEYFPGKFINITNGISPRRWLIQINPGLSALISSTIGESWQCDLMQLKILTSFSQDNIFVHAWQAVKRKNKERLARYILRRVGLQVNVDTLFDVHVKRLHEYKRQLLNVLHVVTLYNRIKMNATVEMTPRTIIFAGKAAPGYFMAKLIIKLINSIAETINNDPAASGLLQVVFLPNYCVSQAEKIIPAADLSEQISTAGMEASGTGNMKFALNGALTIGTLDGANVEILQEVGEENIFIFGLKAEEVSALRSGSCNPREFYEKDEELKAAIGMISSGVFSRGDAQLFEPIIDALLNKGDYYCVLADYRAYMDAQDLVGRLYRSPDEWARRAILNTANMGKFSSDRAVSEYAQKVWNASPVEV
jgi:glycogen phosphorylase